MQEIAFKLLQAVIRYRGKIEQIRIEEARGINPIADQLILLQEDRKLDSIKL